MNKDNAIALIMAITILSLIAGLELHFYGPSPSQGSSPEQSPERSVGKSTSEKATQYVPKTINVGIVKPTFTAAAYNKAFYQFYQKHDNGDTNSTFGKNITTDLQLLTAKIPKHNPSAYGYEVLGIVKDVTNLLPNANVTILTDGDIDEGKIFKTNGTHLLSPPMAPDSGRAYGILILGHQEYVTQKEYDNLKNFVANGGTIIFLDANIFYAEVSYDKAAQTVTLMKGHGYAFNGKTAWKSLNERWENETSQWVGSNFYYWGGNNYDIKFETNPFNYTHFEEQYITNPNVKVILDYRADPPNIADFGYPKPEIAIYEMEYLKGKVIVFSIFSDHLIDEGYFIGNVKGHENFMKFFNTLLLRNIPNG